MEERLDDALNVLRSHCEPQLNMPIGSGMESAIGNTTTFANVPTQPQSATDASALSQAPMPPQDSVALPIDLPVKIERSVPSVSSEFELTFFNYSNLQIEIYL